MRKIGYEKGRVRDAAAFQNGAQMPRQFDQIVQSLTNRFPRYKIVVQSIKNLSGWRLIHAYYISLLADSDPSRIKSFMYSIDVPETAGFESGRVIDGMSSYRLHLEFEDMIEFSGRVCSVVQQYVTQYVLVRYHNLVQFSDRYTDGVVPNLNSFGDFAR